MHLRDWHSTTIDVPATAYRPSSATVGDAGHPQTGYWLMQIRSSAANRACSAVVMPIASVEPQQSVWWTPMVQSPAIVQVLSNVGNMAPTVVHMTTSPPGGDASLPPPDADALSALQPVEARTQTALRAQNAQAAAIGVFMAAPVSRAYLTGRVDGTRRLSDPWSSFAPVRILGLDPGSRVCGYGVIDERAGELTYVECGLLTAPEDRAMEQRLGELARGLREVIAELSPEVVAIEDVFSHQNVRSAIALAQARGMALAVVGLCGLSVASYAPALVKKAVSGSGRADKTQIARMVQALIGLRSLPRADATDALAVAITHGRRLRPIAARLMPAMVRP